MPSNSFLKLSGNFFSEGTYSGGGNLYATFKRIEKKFVKKTQVVVKLKFKCKGLFSGNTSVKNGRLSLLVHTRVYKKKNKQAIEYKELKSENAIQLKGEVVELEKFDELFNV